MKKFFAWLFSQNNSSLKIGLFDGWHFLYLFIVFGGTLALSLIGQKKPDRQQLLTKIMAYLTVGLYIIDFFIMPLSDSYNGISAYKLPFNICTIMAVLTLLRKASIFSYLMLNAPKCRQLCRPLKHTLQEPVQVHRPPLSSLPLISLRTN